MNNVFWTLTFCNFSRDILSLFHVQDFHEELMKFREQVNSRIQSQITQAEIPLLLPLPPPSHFIVCWSSDFLIQGPYNLTPFTYHEFEVWIIFTTSIEETIVI